MTPVLKWVFSGVSILFASLMFSPLVMADGTVKVFEGTSAAQEAMLVSLNPTTQTSVSLASNENCAQLIGIVAPSDTSLGAGKVRVATDGIAQLYVSTINGDVSRGDAIGCSSLLGVGGKASAGLTVGRALASLDKFTARSQIVNSADGKPQKVLVGSIPVLINVGTFVISGGGSILPASIQGLANNISGRNTEEWRILTALIMLLVVLLVSGVTLYSGIRHSFVAIGRNPLAASQIHMGLTRVVVSGVAIIITGLVSSYLVLVAR